MKNLRGGVMEQDFFDTCKEILDLANKNNISFEGLISYTLREAELDFKDFFAISSKIEGETAKKVDDSIKFIFEGETNIDSHPDFLAECKSELKKRLLFY